MPPHAHHGGGYRGFGGRRGRGATTVYLENVPDVVYCDGSVVNGVCIPDREAGDILPTFVTPDDARNYIDEVNAGYARLDQAIQASTTAPPDFKTSWVIQNAAWIAFSVPAKATVGYLNTTAVMQQTDRFNDQLKNWFSGFASVGGTPPGPPPTSPGQGLPGTTSTADVTKLVTAIGVTAAIVLLGPKLLSFFK